MFESQKILIFILLLFCFVISIQGDCQIQYSEDPSLIPILYKYVGTRKIKINLRTNNQSFIYFNENHVIMAKCDNYFDQPAIQTNYVSLKCYNGYIHTKTDLKSSFERHGYSREIYLACSKIKWNLYETVPKITWCPFGTDSYLLGRSIFSNPNLYYSLAAICYDINKLSINSIMFPIYPLKKDFEVLPIFRWNYKVGLNISNVIEAFGTNSITDNSYTDRQFKNWITSLNYQYNSIIQRSKLHSAIDDHYTNMLEILWWPNLRLHNWNNYLEALEYHVDKEYKSYYILAGVSGALEVPFLENCETNLTMKKMVDDDNRYIPMYVWNYIHDPVNENNTVVIGFNSPFQEFYTEDDIIFCPDMCNEISWLKKASKHFRHSTMGIVFCCTFDDVKSSKRLEGFPDFAPFTKTNTDQSQESNENVEEKEEEEDEADENV